MKHLINHYGLLTLCVILMILTVFLSSCGNDNIISVFDDTDDTEIIDTEDTETDIIPPDNAIGGYLKYSLTQIACPACFNETQELDVRMQALFHLPITGSWNAALPKRGECVSNMVEVAPPVNQVSVGSQINFTGGWATGHMINQGTVSQSNFLYTTGYMAEANYNRDTWHDLYISDHEISITNAFKSIHGFDYVEPYELMWIDPSYAFSVALFRSGMTFSWGPSGSDSDFMIMVASYDPISGAYLGNIACMGADTGLMYIPPEYAALLPTNTLASVHFQRHKQGRFAFNRFTGYQHSVWIETHMFWEAVGTGYIE